MVEQSTHNPKTRGLIPTDGTGLETNDKFKKVFIKQT
jgi:hypothetical protein